MLCPLFRFSLDEVLPAKLSMASMFNELLLQLVKRDCIRSGGKA